MKVLNLQCAHQHGFEGWFASADDFSGQKKRGLLSCPTCGNKSIEKLLTARNVAEVDQAAQSIDTIYFNYVFVDKAGGKRGEQPVVALGLTPDRSQGHLVTLGHLAGGGVHP